MNGNDWWCCSRFQSTLPREERQPLLTILLTKSYISIHAPTRGATINTLGESIMTVISIHAPTRGATSYCMPDRLRDRHFNPRSHERSDSVDEGRACSSYDFNPRSHERSDPSVTAKATTMSLFQSTLPREERLLVRSGFRLSRDFNPRSHERSDELAYLPAPLFF